MRENVFFRCGALRNADILRDARFANFVAEPLLQLVVNLMRHLPPAVEAGHEVTTHHTLFQDLLKRPQGLLDLKHTVHRQIISRNRDQHAIRSENSTQAKHAKDRAAVEHDWAPGIEVFLDDSGVEPVKDVWPLAELSVDLG